MQQQIASRASSSYVSEDKATTTSANDPIRTLDGASTTVPDRPRDIGTMSVAEAKRALYGDEAANVRVYAKLHEDKDYAGLGQWGKETEEEIAEKSKVIQAARDRVADKTYLVRWTVAIMGASFLFRKAVATVAEKVFKISPSWARRIGTLFVLLVLARRYAAKSSSGVPSAVAKHLMLMPGLGAVVAMTLNTQRIHNFMLETIIKGNFSTLEINIPTATFVSIMDIRDREHVLKGNMRNYLKNVYTEERGHDPANFEYVFAEVMGRGIFATDKKEWQDHRKIAANMFSGNGLRLQMEHVFNQHADHVVDYLTRMAKRNTPVDVQDVFQCAVFDGFCDIAFGIYPNTIASVEVSGKKPQFLVSFDFLQTLGSKRVGTLPLIWNIARFLGIGEEGQVAYHVKVLVDYIKPVIHKRKNDAELSDKNDLLSLYVNHARKTGQAHMLEDQYLLDLILNFMIAGRDTTACLLTNLTRYLAANPDVNRRMLRDFDKLDSTLVGIEDAKSTPYADAVINETLRLQPSVGNDFRMAVEDDVLPSGKKVLAGTRMMMPNIAIGRDPLLWNEPMKFKPERWMHEGDATQSVKRVDEFVHPVFWGGPRLCLGKDMARFEAMVFMRKMFTKLEFSLVNEQVDETYHPSPVIFYVNGLVCNIKERVKA